MTEFLDALIRAFRKAPRRPAVFDTEIRQHVGLWQLPEPIPAKEILTAFSEHDDFHNASSIVVPLHEAETPELTGEFIEFHPDRKQPGVVFYDFSRDDFSKIPIDTFSQTYPAWRIRYWHPEYSANTTPSFLYESAETSDSLAPVDEPEVINQKPDRGEPLFRELRSFIEEEREAERNEHRDQFDRLSIDVYRQHADGIPYLTAGGMDVDAYGQQSVVLHLHSPDDHDGFADSIDITDAFGIHEGNEVLVDVRNGEDGFPVEAEVLEIEGATLKVGVYWNRIAHTAAKEEIFSAPGDRVFCVGELLNPVTYDRELEAVNTIEEATRKRDILTGAQAPRFEQSRSQGVNKARLNSFQHHAAQQAIRAEDVFCIHGPPGTGKTRTLVEIIRAIADEGHRVLACAHSNQAVDNLLVGESTDEFVDRSSLHHAALEDEISVTRVGEHSTNALVNEQYVGNDRYQSDVVCATTSGAAQFGEDIFDYAVLDEATQASIPAAAIPFSRAKTTILAGDHKQLPPYSSTEREEIESFEISMFEQLLDRFSGGIRSTLRTQYRMNESIAAFPNMAFYDGQLKHGSRNRTWTVDPLSPLEAYDVRGEEQQTPAKSYYNEREVEVVVAEVKRLLDTGIMAEDIGIITPYSGQIGKIRSGLTSITGDTTDIDVSTVDAFQGSERDVIIVSFVRSNDQGYSGFLTFPEEGPRRLNVAMTRAKCRLVLVGNMDTLSTCGPDKRPEESAAGVYAALKSHLHEEDAFTSPPT